MLYGIFEVVELQVKGALQDVTVNRRYREDRE